MEVTDVFEQPAGPFVKGQAVQEEKSYLQTSGLPHWMRGG
jgi:hypothetical protein